MKIDIAPYDFRWKQLFEDEKNLLSEILKNIPHHIEHIGSTAVEDLSAKPIIDIMIGLEDFSLVNNHIEKICQLNYTYISKYEDAMPFRRFFVKELNSKRTHHLHVVQFESEFWKRHLAFRDHLRKNVNDKNDYEQLKKELAKRDWETSNDYADAKTEFIRNMEAKINSPVYITSPIISTLHAFFTRKGGISPAPFASLNFGGSEDDPENISENRKRALAFAGMNAEKIARLNQVHGNEVLVGKPGNQTGDALVTKEKNLTLAVGAADCYPILFHDPENQIIGAAHAGWKGTLARIAKNTIAAMEKLGAEKKFIRSAIGPGISGKNYEVSEEIIQQFRSAGFPESCWNGRNLDLLAANKFVLKESGITDERTWALGRCTTEDDFFSYRRDKGKTGRMWACIMLR